MPEGPWQSVAGDFFGPLDGKYYFVNVCRYSRWFDVVELSSLTGEVVTRQLRKLFIRMDAPLEYLSDNGPPFDSYVFDAFARKFGFVHRKITPYWPRANGAAEAIMKKLARVVQFAKEAGINRQVALDDFLLAYRATPHTSTGVSPSDLMFGHSRTCGLPRIEPNATQLLEWHKKARASDEAYKSKSEKAYNDRMRTSDSVLQVGDHVLLRREEKRKDQTRWDPEPYTITTKNGSMVTAARLDCQTTRNSSWFKRFNTPQSIFLRDQVYCMKLFFVLVKY